MIPNYKVSYLWLKNLIIIYNMYREDEVSVHRACRKRATYVILLTWRGGTIYSGSRPAGYHT